MNYNPHEDSMREKLLFPHFRDEEAETERGNILTKGKPILLSVFYPPQPSPPSLLGRGPCPRPQGPFKFSPLMLSDMLGC